MRETLLGQDTTAASAYANLGDGLAAAEAARGRGDSLAALRILAELRERFPEHAGPYLRAIAILSQLRRFDEVEPLLAEGADRFPNDPAFAIERAWLAYRRGDLTAAIERWREIRTVMPAAHLGYTAGAIALRDAGRFAEADALLADAVVRFPNDPAPRTEYAWLAAAQRDWPEAVRRWALVREHFPDLQAGYLRGAQALSALWQHEAAEALLAEAMARFPHDPAIAVDHAWVAYHRHHLDVAAQRFAETRRRFPDVVAGYTGAATVLRDQFRITEAEAVLEEAQRRFPDEPRLLYEHARLPLFHPLRRERDPEEAMRRTERLLAAFPFFDDGYLLGIRTLRELGRPDEADELAQIGAGILPQSAAIALEHGHNARERGDWPEAIWRYGAVRQRFPDHAGGSIGLAAALSSSDRHAEAEQVLQEAMQRFPGDPAVFAEYAGIAVRQEHWAEALGRWREAQERFPDAKEFTHRIFEAELRLADSQPGESAPERISDEQEQVNANGFFRPRLRDSDYQEKRDGPIRELLRQRAFERLYRPHPAPRIVDKHADLYDCAAEIVGKDSRATILEFGVAHGRSMAMFADRFVCPDARFIGFDSFIGLPEAWLMHQAGAFSNRGLAPAISDNRVSFIKGWFQNTVPGFLGQFEFDPARNYLIHYDADLYSSNLFLLTSIWHHIPEYSFIMDDFTQDDLSALFDFALAYPIEIEFLAQTRGGGTRPNPSQILGRMRRVQFEPDRLELVNEQSPTANEHEREESPAAPLRAVSAQPGEAPPHRLEELPVSQDGSPLLEIERLPDDRMERLLLRPDDDGTRVRRGLLALEEIYSPRRAPLTVSNKNELYTRIAEMIGDVPLTYFEFGVWRGASIKLMAQKFRHAEARFIGFDSFEGLPEKWDPNNDVGQFSTNGATPAVEDSRISFRKGWFQNTVAGVCGGLDHRSGPTLIHFDADLYSSTLYLLTCLSSYFKEYYFLFDEFFPDEVNALREFALAYPIAISFDAAILSNDNRPVQLFGRMKRVPFALDVAPVHAGLEV